MHKVLFYKTTSGSEVILDFIRSLDADERKVIGEDLRFIQMAFPVGLPRCDNLGSGLWEVRSTLPSKREARLIFFQSRAQAALVVVHALIKKTQKTPKAAIDLALKRKREFEP